MCGGAFKLKIKSRMQSLEADAFSAAAVDNLTKRMKTDWKWQPGPKGEIWKKPGESHACPLQANIFALHHNNEKAIS